MSFKIDKATLDGLRYNIELRKKDGNPVQLSPLLLELFIVAFEENVALRGALNHISGLTRNRFHQAEALKQVASDRRAADVKPPQLVKVLFDLAEQLERKE